MNDRDQQPKKSSGVAAEPEQSTERDWDGIPMPLWLQGSVEALQVAIVTILLCAAPLVGIYLTGGFGTQGVEVVVERAGNSWLLMNLVPLDVTVELNRKAAPGRVDILPWGAAIIPFLLSWRAGKRLSRASYTTQFWQPLAGALGFYAAVGLGVAYLSNTVQARASLWQAMVMPALVMVAGIIVGARREAGSWARLLGVDMGERITGFSQSIRWAGSYFRSLVMAAWVGVMSLLCLAALLFSVNLVVKWAEIITVYQGLKAGWAGDTALTLAQMGYFPNFVVWIASWSTGVGFQVGSGSLFSPVGSVVPEVPAIPILAALPQGVQGWETVFIAIPVICGMLAGWWFWREGEDHFEDWLSLKVSQYWMAALPATIVSSAVVGIFAGVMGGILAWASGGSAAVGRFTVLGPEPLITGLWLGVEIAAGVALGNVISPIVASFRQQEYGQRQEENQERD